MPSKLCPFCMRMAEGDTCPHCGKNINYAGSPTHLPAGYVVSGVHPYVLGAALGQGGFGITYIALDMVTNERVAIKEYFPTFCASRTDGTVSAYPNQEETFQKGRERFLDEARVLKSLSDLKCIVNVLDFFESNNTAYLVMEFLEGSSLKDYVAQNGKFPAQKFLGQIQPLMEDIERMHQRGVVHRDIAPDNIMLLPDGQMKLIDFGTARSFIGDRSMTVVVKKGFAPLEQYLTKGTTPSTDVYALAATIYYCITGTVPMDSAERQYDNVPLQPPSALGADTTPLQEKALAKALEIQQKARTQSVQEFLDDLNKKREKSKPEPVKQKPLPRKKKPVWIAAVAAVLAVVALVIFLFASHGRETTSPEMNAPEASAPVQEETTIKMDTPPILTYATDAWKNNVLMQDACDISSDESIYGSWFAEQPVLGSEICRKEIIGVSFLDSVTDAPSDCWDVSEAKDESVVAWVTQLSQFDKSAGYRLYIAADGGINGIYACRDLFFGYQNVVDIDFNNCFHTEETTDMSRMFLGCMKLKSLNLSGLDTSKVTDMSEMFSSCFNLTTLDVSGWDTSNVENYTSFMDPGEEINGRPWEELFEKKDAGASDTWKKNILMEWPDTKYDNISKAYITSVTFLDTLVDAPTTSWDVSEAQDKSVRAWAEKNGRYYNLYIAGAGGINAGNACQKLFAEYFNLKEINFNNSFHTEEAISMRSMFDRCHSLTSLDLSILDTSNVQDMSSMFSGCGGLTSLNLSGWDTSSVQNMSLMFSECARLTSLDLSGWDTSSVQDMVFMFSGCDGLTSLDLSGWDTSSVESHYQFMDPGKKVNGRPWEELFEK